MTQKVPMDVEKFLKMVDDDPSAKVRDLQGRTWGVGMVFRNVTWKEGVLRCTLSGSTPFVLTIHEGKVTAVNEENGARDVYTIINP